MATTDMANAVMIPTASTRISVEVMAMPAATNLMHFTRPQPNMMGMARKNVNSAAAVREQPASMPPMMVAPERLVPGMMANTWKQPILSAVFQSISSTSVILNSDASASSDTSPYDTRAWRPRGASRAASASRSRRRLRRSSTMNTTPYRMSMAATVTLL